MAGQSWKLRSASRLFRLSRFITGAALILLGASPVMAEPQVVCRYSYGGESWSLVAAPVPSPYDVRPVAVGSYFKFRIVFQTHPADLASIKVYVYADRDSSDAPLHQVTYRYPPPADAGAPYGFTGLHRVYEPVRDGELEYWCRMKDGAGDARWNF